MLSNELERELKIPIKDRRIELRGITWRSLPQVALLYIHETLLRPVERFTEFWYVRYNAIQSQLRC